MNELLIYFVKVSVIFTLLISVYFFLLSRLSFHSLNRVVLLLTIPLSLILPFVNFGFYDPVVIGHVSEWSESVSVAVSTNTKQDFTDSLYSIWFYIEIFYWIGLSVGLLLLVLNTIKLFHRLHSSEGIYSSNYSIFRSDAKAVFSCFKWIFIPENYLYRKEDPVLKHEIAHVQLSHSYDLLFAELFIALTWFNPFVLLFRKQLRLIHEFQADAFVLSGSIKKSDYLSIIIENLMIKEPTRFANSFKSSTIKRRIVMITKNKSSKLHLCKYCLMVPLLLVISIAIAKGPGSKPSVFPIKKESYKKISVSYGEVIKTHGIKNHGGIDIVAKLGTPVMATGAGKIIKAKMDGNWGNLVIIDHSGGFHTWYAHMNGITVEVGDIVSMNEIIGHVGSTGKSTGPHLHYEVRENGNRVNPEDFYK